MNADEFIEKMVEHSLILEELFLLHHQYNSYNYMTRVDIENELNQPNKLSKPTPVFVCDGKACKPCSKGECKHTFDVTHAVNFKDTGNGFYEEKSEGEQHDQTY